MLEQSDIDALLESAAQLVDEASGEVGASKAPPAPRRADRAAALVASQAELRRILHMRFPVSVILAERSMALRDVLSLTTGSIIEFDRASDADLDLVVGDRIIGKGKTVKVGEYFGLRIKDIGELEDRIQALAS